MQKKIVLTKVRNELTPKTTENYLQDPIYLKQLAATTDRMQNKWSLRQQSKQKQNRIKIRIFFAMFLMQYFCLHSILRFSTSYPEIESTWPTAKCRGRKSFDT